MSAAESPWERRVTDVAAGKEPRPSSRRQRRRRPDAKSGDVNQPRIEVAILAERAPGGAERVDGTAPGSGRALPGWGPGGRRANNGAGVGRVPSDRARRSSGSPGPPAGSGASRDPAVPDAQLWGALAHLPSRAPRSGCSPARDGAGSHPAGGSAGRRRLWVESSGTSVGKSGLSGDECVFSG